MGILGLPINIQILEIMRGVAAQVATEAAEVNESRKLARQSKALSPNNDRQSKLLISSNHPKVISNCPRCLGAGFRHDSSAKHDKKQEEKCKYCITCKGIVTWVSEY